MSVSRLIIQAANGWGVQLGAASVSRWASLRCYAGGMTSIPTPPPLADASPVLSPSRLVVIGGLSGSGKSVLAAALAPSLSACLLRSDVVRKRLFGVADTDRLPPDAYAPAVTARVFDGLLAQAREALAANRAVVVDAVCARPSERSAFESAAAALGRRFDGIWLDAPLDCRVARVANRRNDASDATAEVAKAQERYDLGPMAWARLDAGRVASDMLADALKRLL